MGTGERDAAALADAGREELAGEKLVRLDYFEFVDPENLDPVKNLAAGALDAVAAYVGSTRLLDNILFHIIRIGNVIPSDARDLGRCLCHLDCHSLTHQDPGLRSG